jgi:hypothetical protein
MLLLSMLSLDSCLIISPGLPRLDFMISEFAACAFCVACWSRDRCSGCDVLLVGWSVGSGSFSVLCVAAAVQWVLLSLSWMLVCLGCWCWSVCDVVYVMVLVNCLILCACLADPTLLLSGSSATWCEWQVASTLVFGSRQRTIRFLIQ